MRARGRRRRTAAARRRRPAAGATGLRCAIASTCLALAVALLAWLLPASCLAGPPAVLAVRYVEGDRLVLDAQVSGAFGSALVIDRPGVARFEAVLGRPDVHGEATLRYSFRLAPVADQPATERKGEVPRIPLDDRPVQRCTAPSVTSSLEHGRFVCMMFRIGTPRPLDPGLPPHAWPAETLRNLATIRSILEEAHPGPKLPDDPAFAAWLRDGFREAATLARNVRSRAQSDRVLAYFVAGFQDGHLALDTAGDFVRWAGFTLAIDGERLVVSAVARSWPLQLPPLGAVLASCDGRRPQALVAEIAPYVDRRTQFEAVRAALTRDLTLDDGGIPRAPLRACTFTDGTGKRLQRTLHWERYDVDLVPEGMGADTQRPSPDFGLTDLGEGRFWVRVPSFAPDDGRREKIEALAARLGSLEAPRLVVFDVRGNGGGSSAMGMRLLEALAGPLVLDDQQLAQAPPFYALWRVSSRNLATLQQDARRSGSGTTYLDGMTQALARGEMWLRQDAGRMITREAVERAGVRPQRYRGAMAVLTDGACASACLDFMDAFLAYPDTTHLGRATSGDTRYLESGTHRVNERTWLIVPRKAWFGRPRGHNERYVPARSFAGDIRDDGAVRAWVLQEMAQR